MRVARRVGDVAPVQVHGRDVAQHGELNVEHRDFEMRPSAPFRFSEQPRHAGDGAVERARHVGRGRAGPRRGAIRLAGERHVPAHRALAEIEGGRVARGALVAVATRVDENDLRIPRPEVRQDGVRRRHEIEEDFFPLAGLEVEDDALLSPVESEEDARCVADAGNGRIPPDVALGGFHLDHLGAHVGEDHSGDRAGDYLTQINDAVAFQHGTSS